MHPDAIDTATQEMLDEIARRGFTVTFDFDGTWNCGGAFAGDCNCPHMKEYDPEDGHGWSHCEIPADSLPDKDDEWTFDNMVRLIHREIMKIQPGVPYPPNE